MPTMLITLYQPISVKSRGLSVFISFLAKNLSSGVNVLLPMVKDIRKKNSIPNNIGDVHEKKIL